MVRNRKVVFVHPKHGNNNESSSSSAASDAAPETGSYLSLTIWKTAAGCVCLSIAVYVGTLGYLETRVNTPFDDEKAVQYTGLEVPDRYWGTYRSGVYMGMKSREPRSPVFGLMWYDHHGNRGIRHWCDQNDRIESFGWLRHDAMTFGEQLIYDPPYRLVTSFVKTPAGDQWTVRVNVTSTETVEQHLSLVWYAALDESMGPAGPESRIWVENDGDIRGYTPQLSNFKVSMVGGEGSKGKILHKSATEAHAPGLHMLKEKLFSLMSVAEHQKRKVLVLRADEELEEEDKDVNFVPVQLQIQTPLVLDIVYRSEEAASPPFKGQEYTRALEEKKRTFDQEFEEKFKLAAKGYSEEDISFARAGLANMVGGIGYFYGAGRVRSQHTKEPVPYWRAALYTAVPSRSFFPRGFLWDEGFHMLLVGRWNLAVALDIAGHWLDLLNVEGWIPREQILGAEALSRVPREFVVQSNAAANPPMLLLTLARLVRSQPKLFEANSPHRAALNRMFSRLQAWYQWFQNTQKGAEPTSYRWRGREDDGLQLNPKTLTSGIDDYPRASHPTDTERHVDLRCWMYAAADAMAAISGVLQRDTSKFVAIRDQLGDEGLLNQLHWSEESQTYADYGLHTDGVKLVKRKQVAGQEPPRTVRVVTKPPSLGLVTSAFGYVSLFPMLLRVLKPESEKLGKILETLDDPELLWSPYGLRSLSKSAPLFMKRNTEHDPPYWRGQVWVNINYLALAALRYYAEAIGPHADRARALHDRLRDNVVGTVLSEYKRTGYYWEQYSSIDGRGSGCRPFTGWTALVVLIMADEY